MFNYRVLALLKRELQARIANKTFLITTIVFPLIFVGLMVFQYFMMNMDGEQGVKIKFVTESDQMKNALENEFSNKSYVKDGQFIVFYESIYPNSFDNKINDYKSEILGEEISYLVFLSDSATISKNIELYSKDSKNIALEERLGSAINNVLISNYFANKDLSKEEIDFARSRVDIKSLKISKDEKIEESSGGQIGLAYAFGFLLYISFLMTASLILQAVIEEKANRIVEVILSSVGAKELMIGKIVGGAFTGLVQMFIWLLPVLVVVLFSLPVLPESIIITLTSWQIIYYFVNYFIGMLIFSALAGTVGAIYDNPQDAQSGFGPIVIVIMIPFFITMVMLNDPTNPLGTIASMLPFTNLIVMPVRMTLVDIPVWQFVLSFVINIATFWGIFPIAGKIYQIGILKTGSKPKFKDIISWLKMS